MFLLITGVGFFIDTSILEHVEGFNGVYYSAPIAFLFSVSSMTYFMAKFISQQIKKKERFVETKKTIYPLKIIRKKPFI